LRAPVRAGNDSRKFIEYLIEKPLLLENIIKNNFKGRVTITLPEREVRITFSI